MLVLPESFGPIKTWIGVSSISTSRSALKFLTLNLAIISSTLSRRYLDSHASNSCLLRHNSKATFLPRPIIMHLFANVKRNRLICTGTPGEIHGLFDLTLRIFHSSYAIPTKVPTVIGRHCAIRGESSVSGVYARQEQELTRSVLGHQYAPSASRNCGSGGRT